LRTRSSTLSLHDALPISEMLKIYPGIENELLQGAIDCHIHAYPDFVHRSQDMLQIAVEASKCGMRAVAFKDHWNISATSAYLTQDRKSTRLNSSHVSISY